MNCCNLCPVELCPALQAFIFLAVILEITLKGFALWRAAQRGEKGWFVALMVINTVGIFPLVYLLVTGKKKED